MAQTWGDLDVRLQSYKNYPMNSNSPDLIHRVLELHQDRLKTQSDTLFKASNQSLSSKHSLLLWDLHENSDEFNDESVTEISELQSVLKKHVADGKEPRYRYAFIEAQDSLSALECSLEIFQLLSTYHDISPGFLDLLYSFGRDTVQNDFYHTYFYDEYLRGPQRPVRNSSTHLERSGHELRLCYKLQSIEFDEDDKQWRPRHAAMYHSFDIEKGKSFWLTVKANDEISYRLRKMTKENAKSGLDSEPSPASAFMASLRAHLVALEWSAEGWRWWLRDKEQELRSIFEKGKLTQFHEHDTQKVAEITRSTSMYSKVPARATFNSTKSAGRHNHIFSRQGTSHSATGQSPASQQNLGFVLGQPSPNGKSNTGSNTQGGPKVPKGVNSETWESIDSQLRQINENLKRGEAFNIREMQKLNHQSSILHEYKLSMTLNSRVVSDVRDYYESLYDSVDCPNYIRKECRTAYNDFQRRARRVERLFESEHHRIDTLINLLNDSKQIFDLISQFHNSEIHNLFAISSHKLSDHMRQLAEKTERDTSSMHVITFFTLLFLPGTFLGSFFSTPIFESGDNGSWTTNSGLMDLFVKICVPMMVVTILVWGCVMWTHQRRKQLELRAKDDEEAAQQAVNHSGAANGHTK